MTMPDGQTATIFESKGLHIQATHYRRKHSLRRSRMNYAGYQTDLGFHQRHHKQNLRPMFKDILMKYTKTNINKIADAE